MGAGEIRAGGAFVEIFVKGNVGPQFDKLAKKLKDFGAGITAIGKKMTEVGAAITSPLAAAALAFAITGKELENASKRTGVAVETLSELKFAADATGASMGDVEAGIRKMSKAIFEAEKGSKEARQALASLGLSVDDLKGKTPDQQFQIIADKLNTVEDAGTKAAIAMELFGKGGTALLPMIQQMDALRQHARDLGIVMSSQDAEAAEKFDHALDDVSAQLKTVIFQVGAAVASTLQPFAGAVTRIMKTVIEWAKENRGLIATVFAVGAAILAGGIAIIGLGTAFTVIGAAITGFLGIVSAIGAALALLLNPIVLVVAGVAGLAAWFLYASGAGEQMVNFLTGKFNELLKTSKETFGGIADALGAGDIGLAAQILWTGLKLAWTQGTQEIMRTWYDFRAEFVKVAAAAFYGSLSIWAKVKAALLSAFEATSTEFGNIWDAAVGIFEDLWFGAIKKVKQWINDIKGFFDDSFDVDAANAALDRADDKRAADRQKEEQDKLAARETEKAASLKAIDVEKAATLKALDDTEAAISAAADQNANQDVADLEKKKADLQKKLDDLRAKSKDEKQQKDADDKLNKLGDPKKLITTDEAATAGRIEMKSAGIFNPAAIQALQGGPTQDRIAKATEETAKNTKAIARQKSSFT